MARINIPLDALTSRLNLAGRFEGVRSQSVATRFANLRPLGEFFALKRISKPRDFGDVQSRINHNLSYFSSNYAAVFVMLSIYSLLTNLLLLFVIFLVVGGMFGIGKLQGRDLDVGFARATTSQLYTGLFVIAVPLGLWASPIGTVLWLIGASGVSILGHAAFLERPIEDSFSGNSALTSNRRRFRARSAAQYSSPKKTGRPPGAPSGGSRRLQDWELRPSARYGERFEELDSEDDRDGGDGVYLDSNTYAARAARQRGFAGDLEFYGDGYNNGQDRQRRRPAYDDLDSEEEEYYRHRGRANRGMAWEQEDAVLQAALERIARARAKGKTTINLSVEEMEALERRPGQQPEPPPPAMVSPPATPQAKAKAKVSSRSNSGTRIAVQKTRKRGGLGGLGGLFGQTTASAPAKPNTKAKVDRKSSTDNAMPYPPGGGPQGIMVPGPNGVPVYASLVYGPPGGSGGPASPELTRVHSAEYAPRSRSTSKHNNNNHHNRRESTPPGDAYYQQYPTRYFSQPASASFRPPSSSSAREAHVEEDWYPPSVLCNRSASNVQYPSHHHGRPPLDEYDIAPGMPPSLVNADASYTGRRNVSGPPDVRYSTLRRVPPASSPLAPQRPVSQHTNSDPSAAGYFGKQRSGLSREHTFERRSSREGSDTSDEYGGERVEVEIEGGGSTGYEVRRMPASTATGTGGKKKKGKDKGRK